MNRYRSESSHQSDENKLYFEILESRQMLSANWVVDFIDDFSTDTSTNYTQTAPLARPGSALPTMNISGGALTLTGAGQTGDVTQAMTFHNTETLEVGETLLLDVNLPSGTFGDGNEMIGITVSEGIMTGVNPIPPASNQDVRDDEFSFIFGGFRSSGLGDDFRSDGFVAINQGQISGGEQVVDQSGITGGDLSKIASLYITRVATNTYEMGWIDDTDALHQVRTITEDLGANPSIGVFTDMRDDSGGNTSDFDQTVDNLRIVYEDDPYPANPVQFPRQVEDLNRGVVAVRKNSSDVYISWRQLGTDPSDVAFEVYRSEDGGLPVKLTWQDPVTNTTDFVDSFANLSADNAYYVRPIIGGIEQAPSESFTLPASAPVQQHIDIPIQKPAGGVTPAGESYDYNAVSGGSQGLTDASVGDLDGDGQYEVIVKWEPSNKSDNQFGEGFTGNTYIDAYSIDEVSPGNHLLWRIDLGINIRSGQQHTPFLVYDFDGDGRSEVVIKTADGTVDGQGTVIGNALADWREPVGATLEGQVVTGPEYLTVFDGLTGAELSTVDFPLQRDTLNSWGDDFGNRSERYMAAVAYLDGQRPSIVWTRGIYGPSSQPQSPTARNEQVAFDWRDGQLTQRWRFNAVTGGANDAFVGEGAQSLSVADVDGDGFDEIVYGAAVVDHDGTLLYATGLGHGDALHVSDMVPSNPGLEIFMPHEDATGNGGIGASLRDAMTGALIVSIPGTGDVGRGLAADIEPLSPGYEIWATSNETIYSSEDGSQIGPIPNVHRNRLYNFAIWWDGDLSRELLNEDTIWKWNGTSETAILEAWQDGAAQSVEGKWTPALQADIFGDWREEVIWRKDDNTELQIWTTTISATNRMYTLMHDTQYREAVAWQNVGYNQPPHPSFFLGTGMADPPEPVIYLAGQGDFNVDGNVDGLDFLQWQRGVGTIYDQNHLADWEANYGAPASSAAVVVAVTETVSTASASSVTKDTHSYNAETTAEEESGGGDLGDTEKALLTAGSVASEVSAASASRAELVDAAMAWDMAMEESQLPYTQASSAEPPIADAFEFMEGFGTESFFNQSSEQAHATIADDAIDNYPSEYSEKQTGEDEDSESDQLGDLSTDITSNWRID